MDLSKMNAAAKPGTGLLPLVRLYNLKTDVYYIVTNIYKAKTKFGEEIMVNLEDSHAGFLPRRMTKFFEANPKDLETLQVAARNSKLLLINVGGKDSPNHIQFAFNEGIPIEVATEVVEIDMETSIKE